MSLVVWLWMILLLTMNEERMEALLDDDFKQTQDTSLLHDGFVYWNDQKSNKMVVETQLSKQSNWNMSILPKWKTSPMCWDTNFPCEWNPSATACLIASGANYLQLFLNVNTFEGCFLECTFESPREFAMVYKNVSITFIFSPNSIRHILSHGCIGKQSHAHTLGRD